MSHSMPSASDGFNGPDPDDPWAVDYPARIQLAISVLQHAKDQPTSKAIDRAVLALRGATIDEIRELTA